MIKIDKRYTIKYSKGGVCQYADFNYSENKLINHSFRPSWVKQNESPSLENLVNIQDILKVIKEWSYNNQAEIILLNGNPLNYTSKDAVNKYSKEFEEYFENFCLNFFKSEILPILQKNKWKISYSWMQHPIIICKSKKEYQNIDTQHEDSVLIEVICNKFLKNVLRQEEELDLRREHGYVYGNSFNSFFYWLNEEKLIELNIFINIEEIVK